MISTMRNFKATLITLSALSLLIAPPSYAEKKGAKKKNDTAKVVQSPTTAKKEASQKTAAKDSGPMAMGNFGDSMGKEPTYIKSDSLSLRAKDRVFVYTGNVEVVQGDMTLTADTIEGTYNDQNKIDTLTAKSNVTIIKGDGIKAHSETARYDAKNATMILTDNPELSQNGSLLTADVITIFLNENRSTAEGQVRVKLLKPADGKKAGFL